MPVPHRPQLVQELQAVHHGHVPVEQNGIRHVALAGLDRLSAVFGFVDVEAEAFKDLARHHAHNLRIIDDQARLHFPAPACCPAPQVRPLSLTALLRSEEHTSELQSLMRNSYAVFCLKKKTIITT